MWGNTWRRVDPDYPRAMILGAVIGLWIGCVIFAVLATLQYLVTSNVIGFDAHAYWLAGRTANPYGRAPGQQDAFLYTPMFAQAMHPLALMPWHVFEPLWIGADAAAFVWLLWPLRFKWRVPALLLTVPEVLVGNIHGLIAAAVVVGLAFPLAWGFPLLTKVTPGGPGFVWLAARAQWRSLIRLCLELAVLIGLSIVLSPSLWRDWWQFSAHQARGSSPGWLVAALIVSLVVTAVAARLDLPWVVPIAVMIALPRGILDPPHTVTVLAAIPRLVLRHQRRERA